jgi:sec-independent protein translocase protein TatC
VAAALAKAYHVPPDEPDKRPAGEMSFLEHLDELRSRIIRSSLAICAGMLLAVYFLDDIVNLVLEPTLRMLPAGAALVYTQPSEAFSFKFNIALVAGTVIASPFIFFQVWVFVAPGLHAHEKKFVRPTRLSLPRRWSRCTY